MAAKDPLSRSEEIEQLVANNNLNDATKQLMDFQKEFSIDRAKKREVILIKSQYKLLNDQNRLGTITYEKYNLEIRKLKLQILEFKDSIIDEYNQHNLEHNNAISETSVIDNTSENTAQESSQPSKTKYEIARENFLKQKHKKQKRTQTVVKVVDIGKRYKSKVVNFCLSPINLELNLGEITTVVGENGNGKTTLLRIIAGDLAISEGELTYPLLMKNNKKDWYLIKQKIAYLPQELPKWYGSLMTNLHFTATINGIKGQDNIDEVNWMISRLGLEEYRQAKWSEISSGYKTRFSLARALVWKPKLLVFDEPLANLDINVQATFLQDLRDIINSQKHPLTAIISSQHLYEVESIADKIIFLKDGEAKYNGLISEFNKERECNIYEINCNVNQELLMNLLKPMGCSKIKESGTNFIIYVPVSVSNAELLQVLATHKVSIKYFRDISQSTRQLFET
ncbi:MAG: ATP-binding cassette domain-containing protein [Crocosphaera sp.]|nr:ATP-binding cassette domain-containing protein [Crocosphaera sp.]